MNGGLIDGWGLDQRRRGLMPSTIYRRRDMVRCFARWLGETQNRDLIDATEDDVELFLDGRRIGSRTRYTWISALGCFYDHAVRTTDLMTNPARDIARPKLRRTLPRPATDAQVSAALALAVGQHRVWFVLAAYAGLRCAEVAGVHRDDILHDIGRLRVVGKGAKERLVPMHPLVRKTLETWPQPRANGPLFHRPSGGPWPGDQLSREANAHLRYIGVGVTMHQFRHWFGTRTYQACHDIRVVQELMGHASPNTTAIYTAFSDEGQAAAVMALEERPHLHAVGL